MSAGSAAGFGVELALMIALPVALSVWVRRRFGVPWPVFLVASGFFLANLVVNVPLTAAVWPALFGRGSWATLAATAVTYGVCEETARYLSFRVGRSMRAHRTANGALAAGLGHGGTESVVFGLQYVYGMLVILLAPGVLPPGVVERTLGTSGWTFALTGADRIIAMACHVGFATLVVLAYRRSVAFLPVAMVVHAAVDFTVFGVQRVAPGSWHELVFLGFAVAAVALHLWARTHRPLRVALVTPAAPVHLVDSQGPRTPTGGVARAEGTDREPR